MRNNNTEPLSTLDFLQSGGRKLNLSGFSNVQNQAAMLEKARNSGKKKKDDIEKGAVSDALSGYNSAFRDKNLFEKTGKDIKAKVESLVTAIKAKKEALIEKTTALEEKIGVVPTQEPDEWELREFPDDSSMMKLLKRYPYQMCYYNETSNNGTYDTAGGEKMTECAESAEQAKLCQSYNTAIYEVKDCMRDLKIARVFLSNVDEEKSYQLTLSDLQNLGF